MGLEQYDNIGMSASSNLDTGHNADLMMEQYKIAVQMADNVSQRRGTANSFYISMLTLLLAVTTAFSSTNRVFFIILSILGLVVSFSWIILIRSYKRLNTAKFSVINKMEEKFPFSPFSDEWRWLLDYSSKKHYLLTDVELVVPIVFIFIFLALFVLSILGVPIEIKA